MYFLGITAATFFVFGLDKARSVRAGKGAKVRRVPEATLWLLMFVGGTVGALLGMNYFRHKTQKISFQAGATVILAMQVAVIFLLWENWG